MAPIAGVGEVVMAHELPDGRFNLVVRGHARVRIDDELASDRPYRLVVRDGAARHCRPRDAGELRDAEQSLRALIGQLADAIPEGGEPLRQVVGGAETPAALADVVAAELIADVGAAPAAARDARRRQAYRARRRRDRRDDGAPGRRPASLN